MSGNTKKLMVIRRGHSPGRIIIGLLFGLITGWIFCTWLVDLLEVQPLYRLRNLAVNRQSFLNVAGPWLCIFQETDDQTRVVTQYRRLTDGQLEFQTEQSPSDVVRYYHVIHHPALGPNTLIGTRRRLDQDWALVLYQHTTDQERVIYRWDRHDVYLQLSHGCNYFSVVRVLPLTPLLGLALNGLPGAVNMGFYHSLGQGELKYSAFRVSLVQVYSSINGQLQGSCALPCQLGIHVDAKPLDDGEHLLISCRTNSNQLGNYFTTRCTAPEDQAKLAALAFPLSLLNYRSGLMDKEWPDMGQCSLDQLDEVTFHHRSNDIAPVLQWAQARPDQVKHRILNTKTHSLLELKRPASINNNDELSLMSDQFLLHSDQCLLDNQQQTVLHTTLLMTNFDSTGSIVSEKKLEKNGAAQIQPIKTQQQIIIKHVTAFPWQKLWSSWTQRWPWLKRIHKGYSSRICVWDTVTDEEHLVTTSNVTTYEATPDGQYLLVTVADNDNKTAELSVYALPFTPITMWAIWVPRLTGVATVILVFMALNNFAPRYRK